MNDSNIQCGGHSHFWNTGVFTTLTRLQCTLTGQGGRWTGELKCYFGKESGEPMPGYILLTNGLEVHREFLFFKQIIGNMKIYILKHYRPHKSTQMTEIKGVFPLRPSQSSTFCVKSRTRF